MELGRLAGALAAAGILLVCFASSASTALAAAPANDAFANRETLSGSLPIEVSRSNVEAMKEPGESLETQYAAGHSVWFRWQAPSTAWTSIGACQSTFHPLVAIFEGTALGSLQKVVRNYAFESSSLGPHCGNEREFTFKATAGTTYAIAVDGNTLPSFATLATEGQFALRIESTPVPVNDDFQNATTLKEEAFTVGSEVLYETQALGYNWGATKEAGEPSHPGSQGGASVWYSWTAPESGTAEVNLCCSTGFHTDVYVGDAVNGLTPVADSQPVIFPATAGSTYRIAVDGRDEGPGVAWMGSFSVRVSLPKPEDPFPLTPAPVVSQPGAQPPTTTIFKRKLLPRKRLASFGFRSSEPRSGFQCKLDSHPFAACKSPDAYKHLSAGRHTFKVIAVDAAGNKDPTPAIAKFRFAK